MYPRLAAFLRLRSLPRRDGLDDRATVLSLFARFVDELGSGLLVVLMPALRARLGLSVEQVAWCFQALATVGAVVEPLSAVAVDVVRRRPLLVAGAAGWAAALVLAAGARSVGWVLVAFALAGAAYGPLANTADVVLLEGHPDAVERISGRATVVDTVGALLAPAAVAVVVWGGIDPRGLLATAGVAILGYAVALSRAVIPGTRALPPAGEPVVDADREADPERSAVADVRRNLRDVLGDPVARGWAATLVLVEVLTLNEVFEPIHLAGVGGLSQALVGVHVAVGTAASLVALLALDRWLATHDAWPVLVASTVATLVTYPTWLVVPGAAAKIAVAVVHEVVAAPVWPILHARALAAVPGRAGAMTALVALVGFLPLHAAFGWLAGRAGLTASLLGVQLGTSLALLALLRRLRQGAPERSVPQGGGADPTWPPRSIPDADEEPEMLFGQEHVHRYRETDGEVGHEWQPGVYTLLLTTTGRRSGNPFTTPLIYGRDGDDYVVVASKGGDTSHPDWYFNLRSEPEVEIQVGSTIARATAHDAAGAERTRLWELMTEIWPQYDEYAQKTQREIPVVVLTPH